MRRLYEMHGQGHSIRQIAAELDLSRNTVRKYLRSPGVPKAPRREPKTSCLEPFKPYLMRRLSEGVENCVVLLREIREQGYTGGYSVLKRYVHPLRRPPQPKATVRFETEPGDQAQVDFGRLRYVTPDGRGLLIWVFVLVLSWSRAMYVEFLRRADVSAFVRCHLHAFERLGGLPRKCLYDNTKLVVLGRDTDGTPRWNERFLDFALRLGFEPKLCRPYRPQTKGRVERGVGYVEANFWPTARFVDVDDLNRQGWAWADAVAHVRVHGTTRERPVDRLAVERPSLQPLPRAETLTPFLREDRRVGRDGFVSWDRAWYGVPWTWAGQTVQLEAGKDTVEIWAGEQRVAVHPRASAPAQRLIVPGQWAGLTQADAPRRRAPTAVQVPTVEVQRRSLAIYEEVAAR